MVLKLLHVSIFKAKHRVVIKWYAKIFTEIYQCVNNKDPQMEKICKEH